MFAKTLRIFNGKRDPFLLKLTRAGLGDATFGRVMPERERIDGPPPRRDGPDVLDSMTNLLRPAIDKIGGSGKDVDDVAGRCRSAGAHDALTIMVDGAGKLERQLARNAGGNTLALETTGDIRDARLPGSRRGD